VLDKQQERQRRLNIRVRPPAQEEDAPAIAPLVGAPAAAEFEPVATLDEQSLTALEQSMTERKAAAVAAAAAAAHREQEEADAREGILSRAAWKAKQASEAASLAQLNLAQRVANQARSRTAR